MTRRLPRVQPFFRALPGRCPGSSSAGRITTSNNLASCAAGSRAAIFLVENSGHARFCDAANRYDRYLYRGANGAGVEREASRPSFPSPASANALADPTNPVRIERATKADTIVFMFILLRVWLAVHWRASCSSP